MSRRFVLWEESEHVQRIQLLCVYLVFAVFFGVCFAIFVWNRDWSGILLLAAAFGSLALGVAIWAGMMVLLMYGGLGIASLWRTLRAARGDNP